MSAHPPDAWNDKNGLRWYTFGGQDFLSVTSMRKALGLPYNLHNWQVNQYLNAILDDPNLVTGIAYDEESWKQARSAIRKAGETERDQAAERGTDVHAFIASGRPIEEAEAALQPYIRQYAKAVVTLGIHPLLTERQVFNTRMSYAGSFDLLATLERLPDAPTAVVDLKTGKGIYPEHALQCYSYLRGEFVGENGVIDEIATAILRATTDIGVLHLSPTDWHFHHIRIDEGLHRAWFAMCLLAWFLTVNADLSALTEEVYP